MGNCVIASATISPLLGLCIGYLKVTGKRVSPLRSQILPSPILFKEVSDKVPMLIGWLFGGKIIHYAKDYNLVREVFRILLVWWNQNDPCILISRIFIILKSESRSTVLDVEQQVARF